jgi:CHASE2 domain-containing sensor protein
MRSREELEVVRSIVRMALLVNALAISMYLAYIEGFKGLFEAAALLALLVDVVCLVILAYQSFDSVVALAALIIALAAVFLTNTSLLINVAEFIIHTPSLLLAYLAWMSTLLLASDRHTSSRLKALSRRA